MPCSIGLKSRRRKKSVFFWKNRPVTTSMQTKHRENRHIFAREARDYTSIIYKWKKVAFKQQEGIVRVYVRIMLNG
ncbi:Uncharacterized protein APZ42_019468 [Daphnia magna]|uniref:Uncharacterized protein n=1 Tax=Daphnia magna TaxID=35525 RepID=A0A0P5TPT7_9CRUS|nr:Uncharacterized protein APZ42_019468 [Daphnia magna]